MVEKENSRQTYPKEIRYCLMGVAMIMIVLFHVSQTLNSDDVIGKLFNYVFGEGWVGVDLFFLLSTFGLCYSYNNNSLSHFYKRRIFRLIPLYPLALIIGIVGNNLDISHALWTFFLPTYRNCTFYTCSRFVVVFGSACFVILVLPSIL